MAHGGGRGPGQEHTAPSRRTRSGARADAGNPDLRGGRDPGALHRARRAARAAAAGRVALPAWCRRIARRQVRVEGHRSHSGQPGGRGGGGGGQLRGARRAHRGCQRAVGAGGGVRCVARTAGEGVRRRLSEHGAGDSRCRRRLPGRRRRLVRIGQPRRARSARNPVDRPGRRPTHCGAQRASRSRVAGSRQHGNAAGRRPRCASDHRRRARVPQSRRQRDVGARRQHRRRGGLPAGAHRVRPAGGQGLGADQFPPAAADDQFLTIAQIRALRRLWARVAEVVGEPDSGAAVVHTETSLPMITQRGPWVNMLRTTLAAFGAGVGGADTVLVFPFAVAIDGGFPVMAPSFARRMARNIQLLLLEESHVGRILDPAGGSWFVEDLTSQLANQAWQTFQTIEQHGGFVDAHDYIAGQIAEIAARRTDDVAHRKTAITGVNEYPNLSEPPLPQSDSSYSPLAAGKLIRYAAQFEALRDRSDAYLARTGSRPQALLLPLGPLAEHNIRTTFASNLLASGGIEAVNPGTVDADGIAKAVTDAGSPAVAVLCGTDTRYDTEAPAVVDAAHNAGVSHVCLAGPQKAVAGADHQPDEFLTAKINAVEALSHLLDRLGA